MDYLASPCTIKKKGLDQTVGEVKVPSDERQETRSGWGLCPALPGLFPGLLVRYLQKQCK